MYRTKIQELSIRLRNYTTQILPSTEGTKEALIRPFFEALGYNFSDPAQVRPEFTIGISNSIKSDYVIFQGTALNIIIDCKVYGQKLSTRDYSQLRSYFAGLSTDYQPQLAVLTNGQIYKFYAAFNDKRTVLLDPEPFKVINLAQLQNDDLQFLAHAQCSHFSLSALRRTVIKQQSETFIRQWIFSQARNPEKKLLAILKASMHLTSTLKFLSDSEIEKAFVSCSMALLQLPENDSSAPSDINELNTNTPKLEQLKALNVEKSNTNPRHQEHQLELPTKELRTVGSSFRLYQVRMSKKQQAAGYHAQVEKIWNNEKPLFVLKTGSDVLINPHLEFSSGKINSRYAQLAARRTELLESGNLQLTNDSNRLVCIQDTSFTSSSAVCSLIHCGSMNGRTLLVTTHGVTLKELEETERRT